jgi:hypothetical protein
MIRVGILSETGAGFDQDYATARHKTPDGRAFHHHHGATRSIAEDERPRERKSARKFRSPDLQYITLPASDIWRLVKDVWSLATTPQLGGDQLKWERSRGVGWLWDQFAAYRALEEKVTAGIALGTVPATALGRSVVGAFQSPPDAVRDYLAVIDDQPWNYTAWWPKGSVQP